MKTIIAALAMLALAGAIAIGERRPDAEAVPPPTAKLEPTLEEVADALARGWVDGVAVENARACAGAGVQSDWTPESAQRLRAIMRAQFLKELEAERRTAELLTEGGGR